PPEPRALLSAPAPSPPPPRNSPPRRILLVEDDADIGETTCAILRRDGHTVELATSAEEALAMTSNGVRYDIVLCDLRLPGMSGFELAERLRPRLRGTPIFALSGWAHQIAED